MLRRVEETRPSLDLNAKALKSEPGPVLTRIRTQSALAEARIRVSAPGAVGGP